MQGASLSMSSNSNQWDQGGVFVGGTLSAAQPLTKLYQSADTRFGKVYRLGGTSRISIEPLAEPQPNHISSILRESSPTPDYESVKAFGVCGVKIQECGPRCVRKVAPSDERSHWRLSSSSSSSRHQWNQSSAAGTCHSCIHSSPNG